MFRSVKLLCPILQCAHMSSYTVQAHRMYTAKSEPNGNYRLRVRMISWFIDCNKSSMLGGVEVGERGGCVCERGDRE